jgi:hypothetical protein
VSAKIHAREFGKLAPYLRYKGCQPRERLVAVTREPRLFNQNIGGRQIERLCTAAEACPVLVSESRFQPDEGPVNGGGNYDPLKVPYASLNKNRPYAGNPEHPRVPIAVTISRCGQSAGKADLKSRSEPSETLRRSPRASGEDKVRPSRRREEVTRNRDPPESLVNQVTRSNRSERNTLSLNWRLA